MATIRIATLLELAPKFPAQFSILLRGDHGIGKSQIVRQIAAKLPKPLVVVDRRISQMSDGDMIGLPHLENEATHFAPPDWYMECCREPRLLFLDEFNRGTQEIMQACFQIVLDREMNGYKLHPETRVMAAINLSGNYNVNAMDPALLDRLWTVDLDPDHDEWLAWARSVGIHSNIVDFIMTTPDWLDPPKKSTATGKTGSAAYDPTEVHPSRRSWEMLDVTLKAMGLIEEFNSPLFYATCLGRIGLHASMAWTTFLRSVAEQRVTGADVLDEYLTVEKKTKKRPKKVEATPAEEAGPELGVVQQKVEQIKNVDKINALIDSVTDEIKKRGLEKVTEKQGKNIAAFMKWLKHEHRFAFWTSFSQNQKFIISIHEYVVDYILEIYGHDPSKPADQQTIVEPEFIKKKHEAEQAKAAEAEE